MNDEKLKKRVPRALHARGSQRVLLHSEPSNEAALGCVLRTERETFSDFVDHVAISFFVRRTKPVRPAVIVARLVVYAETDSTTLLHHFPPVPADAHVLAVDFVGRVLRVVFVEDISSSIFNDERYFPSRPFGEVDERAQHPVLIGDRRLPLPHVHEAGLRVCIDGRCAIDRLSARRAGKKSQQES